MLPGVAHISIYILTGHHEKPHDSEQSLKGISHIFLDKCIVL
jgi:hypothetical protein